MGRLDLPDVYRDEDDWRYRAESNVERMKDDTEHYWPEVLQAHIDAAPLISEERIDAYAIELNPQEVIALSHAARGLTDKETAVEMGLAHETVRTHMKRVIARLNAKTRTHAVAIALREELIPFPSR